MILSRRAALNGVQLDEVHEKVVIRSIEPAAGKYTLTAVNTGGPFGQRITGARRDTADISIKFALAIRRTDLQARSEALEAVNAWAAIAGRENGGAWLTAGHRDGRRIRVVLAQAAAEGDLWKWADEFTIVFRAFGVPYWEKTEATSETFGGDTLSGSTALNVGGSAVTQANITAVNTSGATINTMSVTAGGSTMSFSGLGMASTDRLVIDHDDTGLVRIRILDSGGAYRSAMAARTPESADDLLLAPGARTAVYNAQRACRITVEWRERFL